MARKLNTETEVSAIVLCAGLGTRMEDLTKDLPKPCLKVGDRSFLGANLQLLKHIGVKDVYVNSHYLAEKISTEVTKFNQDYNYKAQLFYEPELLEVIGTVVALRDRLKDYFFLFSSESIFQDSKLVACLYSMLDKIIQEDLEAVFLLADKDASFPSGQKGDFDLDLASGSLIWGANEERKYLYTGVALFRKRYFNDFSPGKINFKQFLLAKKLDNNSISAVRAIIYHGDFANLGDKKSFQDYHNHFNLSNKNILF